MVIWHNSSSRLYLPNNSMIKSKHVTYLPSMMAMWPVWPKVNSSAGWLMLANVESPCRKWYWWESWFLWLCWLTWQRGTDSGWLAYAENKTNNCFRIHLSVKFCRYEWYGVLPDSWRPETASHQSWHTWSFIKYNRFEWLTIQFKLNKATHP